MAKTFENGVFQGKTEATMDGIAQSLDMLREEVSKRPCVIHGEQISALRATQRYQWALMVLVILTMAGMFLKLMGIL